MRSRFEIFNGRTSTQIIRSSLLGIFVFGLICFTLSCRKQSAEKNVIRFSRAAEILLDESPFFLYIPTEEETTDYLLFTGYLADMESGEIEVTKDQIDDLFAEMYNVDNLHSLAFEAFLFQSRNESVRKFVLESLESEKIASPFKTALKRKYSAVPEKSQGNDGETLLRYIFNNQFYDENINLFNLKESTFFDQTVGVLLYENNWRSMGFSPEPNVRTFVLGTGGKTNSLGMNFREFSYINFEDFYQEAERSVYRDKFPNWLIVEIPVEGILKKTNADKIIIGCGDGADTKEGIDSAAMTIWLYNSEGQKGIEIGYYMNYSQKSISYDLRLRQCNLLLFNLLFAHIK